MSVSIQTVTEDEADLRLDRFLRRRFPALTQGVLQKLCRTGQIRVDGHRVEASARLVRRGRRCGCRPCRRRRRSARPR